ncbi:MAG: electron transport complex subunit RsxC [Muribaculaceae bacterium]|nr:electron transport complex subunit RsxC [Muribaculaceae bacterium]
MLKTFRKGGIHPPANKTADRSIDLLPLPMVAVLPLAQHIGAPARPLVEKGAHVSRGQLIAEGSSFVSASLHAPVSGTVSAIEDVVLPSGLPARAIVIKADEADHAADTEARLAYWESTVPSARVANDLAPDFLRRRISEAGIVGLGGATFPSHVKLSLKPEQKPEVLVINACECEPYLMCDDALMCAYAPQIVSGIELMLRAGGIPRAIIGIESNKPEAAAALQKALGAHEKISLEILRTKYPQGGEKQLVEAVTGRRIASGALPISVGAVVHNVGTAFAVWQAVATDMPLIERVVTVSGDIPEGERKNYLVAIGTPLSELPFTLPAEARVVVGGPMMGRTAVRLDAPVTKGTSGLTILRGKGRRPVQACVRCGACVDACPMGLEPYLLSTYGRLHLFDEAREADVADCLECGACSYSCPSARPLLDYIRIAKQRSRK